MAEDQESIFPARIPHIRHEIPQRRPELGHSAGAKRPFNHSNGYGIPTRKSAASPCAIGKRAGDRENIVGGREVDLLQ